MTESMSSQSLENTLPLSEQIVRDAWHDFAGSARPIYSVPVFLAWLREHQPQVLENVTMTALVNISVRLCNAEEQMRSSPINRYSRKK